MIVFPNAKINLGLHIVNKRADGYHNLETIFFPVQLSDMLELAETGITGISFSGIPVEGNPESNLVLKAYTSLKKDFGLPPVWFHLHKAIPTGAGLGGGSSDAAFTLKLLNDYFDLKLSVERLKLYAVGIGADCAFFIDNQPAFATGIGNELELLSIKLSDYKVVIVKPQVSVSTVQAYKNVVPAKPVFSLRNLYSLPLEQWKNNVFNDFEKSIFPQFPEIQKLKNTFYEAGAVYSSMSGSGSAVFGIFKDCPSDLKSYFPDHILLNG